jgi:putative sugar O-methyltransferase
MKKSSLWSEIESSILKDTDSINLETFRLPGKINNRLATWDPYENGIHRYYLNILYNLASEMPERFFEIYRSINEVNLGNPVSVKFKGLNINVDYLLSAQEILFVDELLKEIKDICEIGAGFGRTCHSIFENFSNIKSYTIIDLPGCMTLSKRYLAEVLSDQQFEKVSFLNYDQARNIRNVDLIINIDSFAEMEKSTVIEYLSLIDSNSLFFYSRNPVCKYDLKRLGAQTSDTSNSQLALETGLCTEIIDIFDDKSLALARESYLKKYSPGKLWKIMKNEVSKPWQYYQHVLYSKCLSL